MTLYELTNDFRMFSDLLYDEDCDAESIQQACDALAVDIREKADGYAVIINEMKGDIDVLKNEEQRLAKKRKSLENRQKWLKESLQDAMEAMGETKLKTQLFSFNIQKNAPTVEIADEKAFLNWAMVKKPEFVRVANPEIDKKKVLSYLKDGNPLEFAKLKQTESIRIR